MVRNILEYAFELDVQQLLLINDPEVAAAWLEQHVGQLSAMLPPSFGADGPVVARQTLRDALGVISGDYPIEAARKLYYLLGVVHPILGTPDERERYTKFDAYQLASAFAAIRYGLVDLEA